MNRFWVHMEGYQGAVLMLIQGSTLHGVEDNTTENLGEENWLLGMLISEGFSNKSCYYGGRGCCIFALDPVMQPFRPTGKYTTRIAQLCHVRNTALFLLSFLSCAQIKEKYEKMASTCQSS